MKSRTCWVTFLALWVALSALAQDAPQPSDMRRMVVTFEGKLEALPDLTPADFSIEAGKQKVAPTRIFAPTELPTLLAIVLQENQTVEFGTQLPALRDFILGQPPKTYVGLFYLSSQSVDYPMPFDSDLQKVADALRTPKGQQSAAPPTPYEAMARIIEFMHKLPEARKEVLLFSEGSDAIAGNVAAGQNQSLRRATGVAREAGIPVWAIYSDALPPLSRVRQGDNLDTGAPPSPGVPRGPQSSQEQVFGGYGSEAATAGDPFAASSTRSMGVSYLSYLTKHSGGKTFSPGKSAPDIRPFLEDFQRMLTQQFVLEFSTMEPPKKIKLNRKIGGAKMLYPHP